MQDKTEKAQPERRDYDGHSKRLEEVEKSGRNYLIVYKQRETTVLNVALVK